MYSLHLHKYTAELLSQSYDERTCSWITRREQVQLCMRLSYWPCQDWLSLFCISDQWLHLVIYIQYLFLYLSIFVLFYYCPLHLIRPDWNYLPTNTTCPSGTAAIAFTLKLQPYTKLMFPSMSGDRRKTNRAVVGLRLHCGNRNGQLISTIESEMKI